MRRSLAALAAVPALLLALAAAPTNAIETDPFWRIICAAPDEHFVSPAAFTEASVSAFPNCATQPTAFQELPSVGGAGDTSVTLTVGADAPNSRLCFVNRTLSEAPVIRVGAGHRLTLTLANGLHNEGASRQRNCLIAAFGGDASCAPLPVFKQAPGPDGAFYPIEANEAHISDGTTNLHVHGLFVSPLPCSDEVLRSTIYPANWRGPVAPLQPCQTAPNALTYTYDLPADHPSGVYWYHTHRHGQAEQQSQMGLVGAIVVEDAGDLHRRAIGVNDEVLVVGDTPRAACLGPSCDGPNQPAATGHTTRQPDQAAARLAAAKAAAKAQPGSGTPVLDPRVDQVNQAGECATGAQNSAGGFELWTLLLNGAPVADSIDSWPPDFKVLHKVMQPGQRLIFRLVNAAADSYVSPQMALLQNNVLTTQPLEVFARDGVGLADAQGNRRFGMFNVAKTPLIVPPASRVEFVVHAPPVGTTLYLQSAQVNPGCGGNAYPARRLLRITSAGTPVDAGAADDHDLLTGSRPLGSYLSTLNAEPSVHRTFVLAEYGRGFTYGATKWLSGPPGDNDYDPNQTDFFITQVAADDGEVSAATTAMIPFNAHNLAPQVTVHLHGQNSVTEEWLVENSTLEIHAFHMHQIHFRDITVASTDPDQQPVLDVVNVPAAPLVGDVATGYPGAPGFVKLRMTFTKADIGEFVLHCHILEHEDNGMMGKIKVVAN